MHILLLSDRQILPLQAETIAGLDRQILPVRVGSDELPPGLAFPLNDAGADFGDFHTVLWELNGNGRCRRTRIKRRTNAVMTTGSIGIVVMLVRACVSERAGRR